MSDETAGTEITLEAEQNLLELPGVSGDTQIAPLRAISALAMSFALKYHDIATVKDGEMYQQLKLDQKTLEPISIERVLRTAELIEVHLITAERRMAPMLAELLLDVVQGMSDDEGDELGEGDDEGGGLEGEHDAGAQEGGESGSSV